MKRNSCLIALPMLYFFFIIIAPVLDRVRDPRVRVAGEGPPVTFVHQKREAVTIVHGVSATTIYASEDGLRARSIFLSRVPVSIDLPANHAQAELFHRYF